MMEFSKLHNEDSTMIDGDDVALLIKRGKTFNYSQGIWIDIFPLYDVPDDDKEFIKLYKKAKFYRKISRHFYGMLYNYQPATIKWKRPFKAILHFMTKPLNLVSPHYKYFEKFYNLINSLNQPDSKRITEFWPILQPHFLGRLLVPRAAFDETVYLPFEMLTLPASAKYDELLTRYYKDWRTFKINPPHSKFYDPDKSYKYYIEHGLPDEFSVS